MPVVDNDMIYDSLFEMTYDKDDFRCLMTDDFHLSNSFLLCGAKRNKIETAFAAAKAVCAQGNRPPLIYRKH